MPPRKSPGIVFFDFDNTITPFDVLDGVIEEFAVDNGWMALEKKWQAGKIGSKECLEGQLRSLRTNPKALAAYLSRVPIDPFFAPLLTLLRKRKLEFMIVSDSFEFLIQNILRHHGLDGIPVFANQLHFEGDRLWPSFPFTSPECSRCAHCKKQHILKAKDRLTVYVGDGLSDICPAEQADWVFAKSKLLEHMQQNGLPCKPFETLKDLCAFFDHGNVPRLLEEPSSFALLG